MKSTVVKHFIPTSFIKSECRQSDTLNLMLHASYRVIAPKRASINFDSRELTLIRRCRAIVVSLRNRQFVKSPKNRQKSFDFSNRSR